MWHLYVYVYICILFRSCISLDHASFLINFSQLRDHLQGHGETIFYSKWPRVLNSLPQEWSNFATSIYSKKDSNPFDELWAQCILEETGIKAKDDIGSYEQSPIFIARVKKLKKGKFGNSKKKYISNAQCFKCNEYGHIKTDFPNH